MPVLAVPPGVDNLIVILLPVRSLTGTVRLRLSRDPFTHWSVSFVEDPVLELDVESLFQGRPLPHLTTVVSSQVSIYQAVTPNAIVTLSFPLCDALLPSR